MFRWMILAMAIMITSSTANGQSLWSASKSPRGKTNIRIGLGLYMRGTEVTGGIAYNLNQNYRISISGGANAAVGKRVIMETAVFKVLARNPIGIGKIQIMKFIPLNKEGLNLFLKGNLLLGEHQWKQVYGSTWGIGITNQTQLPQRVVIPFVKIMFHKYWINKRGGTYGTQRVHVGVETSGLLIALVKDLRDASTEYGITINYSTRL